MINEIFVETLIEYQKLHSELEAMGAPEVALKIVRKSIDDTKLLIKQREARELESKVIPATVIEVPVSDGNLGLTVGQVFKNYKNLCGFMGWKSTGGDYKKARLKELDSMCKWHNEGYKFVIDKVHQQQLLKEDKRREKAIYVNPIKGILFYALKDFKGELYFSINQFTKLLEMFNNQYYELQGSTDYEEASLEMGIDINTLKGFKIGSKREAQRIIDRALRSMKGQRIIDYVQGRVVVTNDNNYRLATPEERKIIQRIEEEELKKLNCYNMASLKFKNLESKFYYRIRERFDSEDLEYINYTFYGYSITSHDKTISEQLQKLEKEANVIELKGLVKNRLLEFAEGNHKREVKKEYDSIGFGEPMLENNTMASSGYIPNFKKAIETFI